jgi:1-acyl-sn-glycerol-3-phosphate acyltransferase
MGHRWAGRLLGFFGWRVDIVLPPGPKCVIVVYPHTSNWDFVVGYLAKLAAGIPVEWVGKHTLFRPPVAWLLRRMGGIPVNRREPSGFVGQLVRELERRPRMWLAIAPEGTRSYTGRAGARLGVRALVGPEPDRRRPEAKGAAQGAGVLSLGRGAARP